MSTPPTPTAVRKLSLVLGSLSLNSYALSTSQGVRGATLGVSPKTTTPTNNVIVPRVTTSICLTRRTLRAQPTMALLRIDYWEKDTSTWVLLSSAESTDQRINQSLWTDSPCRVTRTRASSNCQDPILRTQIICLGLVSWSSFQWESPRLVQPNLNSKESQMIFVSQIWI